MPAASTIGSANVAEIVIMAPTTADERILFEHAPPMGVQRRLGLVQPGNLNVHRRAWLVVLIGWLPLVVLTIVQSVYLRSNETTSFIWGIGAHARYLIAAPLLILAEAVCVPRLNAIVHHFVETGLVQQHDRDRFNAARASTRRLLESNTAELVVIVLAYLVVAAAALSQPLELLPAWHQTDGYVPVYSPAGWWHLMVSLPLLLVLAIGWLWRLALWARLLWLISRLDLRLVASHPDHAAGLGFLGQSVRAFAIVALAFATVLAGRSAHMVLSGSGLPTPAFAFNVGMLIAIMALFVAPLAAFTPTLAQVWRRGAFEYGALADRVGDAFERKWLGRTGSIDKDALERPDFSAATDLYQVASNVYAIRFIPLDLKDLIVLASAMLLPFVPVVLLAFPLDVIWAQAKSLLF